MPLLPLWAFMACCRVNFAFIPDGDTVWKTGVYGRQNDTWEGVSCIQVALDKDQWRAPVTMSINLRFSLNAGGNFLTRQGSTS
jgi:hypothetical protein